MMQSLFIANKGLAAYLSYQPVKNEGNCTLRDMHDFFGTKDLNNIEYLSFDDIKLDPGVLEFVIDNLPKLTQIHISRIELSKEDWSLLLMTVKRLTAFSMYHIAYDSKLISDALMGSSVISLCLSDCRYNLSTLDLSRTNIISLEIDDQMVTHRVLKQLLAVPLQQLYLNMCGLSDVDSALIASWVQGNYRLEKLALIENRNMTDISRQLIFEAIQWHPRIDSCWMTEDLDHRLSDKINVRTKINQSTRVKRMVPLLAQPPVPKDILRHIYLFLK
jgi:hypothetical protein